MGCAPLGFLAAEMLAHNLGLCKSVSSISPLASGSSSWGLLCPFCRAGVPSLQYLMPDDLRWSWCNNNRKKVHNKCNALGSSGNHPSPWSTKNCLP